MADDLEDVIERLTKDMAKSVRGLVEAFHRGSQLPRTPKATDLPHPLEMQQDQGDGLRPEPLVPRGRSSPQEISRPEPVSPPRTELPQDNLYQPHATDLPAPEFSAPETPRPTDLPHPLAERGPAPLREPLSTWDLKRGFMASDPRMEQTTFAEHGAELAHSDQMTDDLHGQIRDDERNRARIDRRYRDNHYRFLLRLAKDANSDYRRIDDLERRLELSRETITDVNL